MLPKTIFIVFLPLCFSTEVTFENVTFRGYSLDTEKFKKTIPSSNSLSEYLPIYSVFDKIEFKNEYIPILRENSLANLRDLDELIVEYCQLTEIQPGALKNVSLLRRLSLKGNRLEEIKEGVFNNLNLSFLDLSSNLISRIARGAFDDLPNILLISLEDNKIESWNPSWFKNTPHLTTLFMNNNSIGTLPKGAFKNLQGHTRFGLATIDIVLSYNQIEELVPGTFDGVDRIHDLWLDNNKLEHIDEDVLTDVEIHDLKLGGNNIRCLNGDLGKIIKAKFTDLNLNPLDCKCLDKIKAWAKENKKIVESSLVQLDCLSKQVSAIRATLNKFLDK